MQKSQRTNLWLLLIVLVLIILLYLPTTETVTPESEQRLHGINTNTVTNIHLQRGPNDQIVLEKRDGEWWMTSPLHWPANRSRVQSLLKLLRQPYYGKFTNKELDLIRYGLQPPVASIRFNQSHFDFGSTEALNNLRYLQFGDQIYLVEDHVFYNVIAIVPRYLSTQLFRKDEKITALNLPGLNLQQKDGRWQSSDMKGHADDTIRLIQAWQSAVALSVDIDDKTSIKNKPIIKLGLNSQTAPVEFAIIQQQPDLLLLRLDNRLLYQLHPHQALQLLNTAASQYNE